MRKYIQFQQICSKFPQITNFNKILYDVNLETRHIFVSAVHRLHSYPLANVCEKLRMLCTACPSIAKATNPVRHTKNSVTEECRCRVHGCGDDG